MESNYTFSAQNCILFHDKCFISVVKAGDVCSSHDLCGAGMNCTAGTCQCHHDHVNAERTFCHSPGHRLLGNSCVHTDRCYQKSSINSTTLNIFGLFTVFNYFYFIFVYFFVEDDNGYTDEGVQCQDGKCMCQDGLKKDGFYCRRCKYTGTSIVLKHFKLIVIYFQILDRFLIL